MPAVITDPVETARSAGLRYYTDDRPGIRRRRVGKHFSYIGPDGKPMRDAKDLQRFKSLGIPPAWTDVWICPSPRGHIQATGRDARGRKQYRYHPRWREVRDETKYYRMIAFAEALPLMRDTTARDLALAPLHREKVLATAVRLLDATAVRVGNEEYTRENHSFGLTTLRCRHVDVEGSTIHFHFSGKSGKKHEIDVKDRRLARAVQRCQELPGYELFQYLDENRQPETINSSDVNQYLREITGQDFTAKDFRTWHGTVVAARSLFELGPAETETQAKTKIVRAIKEVAQHLGNTPAIARKSYVHPEVLDAYKDGSLFPIWEQAAASAHEEPEGLQADEQATLALLRVRAAQDLADIKEERAG